MGVLYRVTCDECKTYMNLDKADRREEMRSELLKFMSGAHYYHSCRVICDVNDEYYKPEKTYTKENGLDD